MSSTVAFVYMIFKLYSTILATFMICLHRLLVLLIKSPYSYLRTPINLRVLLFTKFYITIIVRYSSLSFTSFASFSGGSKTRFSFFADQRHYCCGW
ncbi:hypothetical protein BGX38DRAFT_436952 [Terfezia claveryi]|nr:hypothetical protein BGX38DRAFT_436952 [Terfezia claveryi]